MGRACCKMARVTHLLRNRFCSLPRHRAALTALLCFLAASTPAPTQEARIDVHAARVLHPVSRYLTGACIEDVNHEIYGGLDSQMIFGESFQEPPRPLPLVGFTAFGGEWRPEDDGVFAAAGDGPKLISEHPPITSGEVGVDLFLTGPQAGNAGLIVKVASPGQGADRFSGYEV